VIIRAEAPRDYAAIRKVLIDAFGGTQEADLVEALRSDGALALALVAEIDGQVCGHVLMSRLASPSAGIALAPLAVDPERQNQGIGSALVREAIELTRAHGARMIFVLGDPVYYERFGFSGEVAAPFQSPYAGPHFMALALSSEHETVTPVVYAAAFERLV